jgi:hypothetical protein
MLPPPSTSSRHPPPSELADDPYTNYRFFPVGANPASPEADKHFMSESHQKALRDLLHAAPKVDILPILKQAEAKATAEAEEAYKVASRNLGRPVDGVVSMKFEQGKFVAPSTDASAPETPSVDLESLISSSRKRSVSSVVDHAPAVNARLSPQQLEALQSTSLHPLPAAIGVSDTIWDDAILASVGVNVAKKTEPSTTISSLAASDHPLSKPSLSSSNVAAPSHSAYTTLSLIQGAIAGLPSSEDIIRSRSNSRAGSRTNSPVHFAGQKDSAQFQYTASTEGKAFARSAFQNADKNDNYQRVASDTAN